MRTLLNHILASLDPEPSPEHHAMIHKKNMQYAKLRQQFIPVCSELLFCGMMQSKLYMLLCTDAGETVRSSREIRWP